MSSSRFRLNSCYGCCSLRAGTLFTGIACIILAIIAIVLLFTVNVHWKTIIIDVDPAIVRVVYTINLVMTILISTLMMIGAIRKNTIMMLPWIVLGILLLIGLLFSVFYTSISLLLNDDEVHHVLYGILFLIFGILIFIIYVMFWFVVYSYFQHIKIAKMSLKMDPYGRPYTYQRP